MQSIDDLASVNIEPPLKKFKALFEESDPDRLPLSFPSESLGITQESHPLSSSRVTDNSLGQEQHPHLFEGDETSQRCTAIESRGTKRRADTEGVGGGSSSSNSVEEEHAARPLKRRAIEGVPGNVVQESQTQGGTELGEPDRDKRFLTALASMKKGKKNENSFDREFNNLRISKPDIEREVKEQEWDLLDGLDDEHNVRGNFMLVVELDVHKKGGSAGKGTLRTGRIDWEGKPDFKKFRKVSFSILRSYLAIGLIGDRKTIPVDDLRSNW